MNPLLRILAAALVATFSLTASADDSERQPGANPDAPSSEEAPKEEVPALPVRAEARPAVGDAIALATDLPTEEIAPESTIVLTSDHALVDLRVRLRDEGGRLVPTRDRATVGQGTVYEVRPVEPLITGTNYQLEIDGQRTRQPSDVAGTSYSVQTFAFRTAGEKPAPPPPPAKPARGKKSAKRR